MGPVYQGGAPAPSNGGGDPIDSDALKADILATIRGGVSSDHDTLAEVMGVVDGKQPAGNYTTGPQVSAIIAGVAGNLSAQIDGKQGHNVNLDALAAAPAPTATGKSLLSAESASAARDVIGAQAELPAGTYATPAQVDSKVADAKAEIYGGATQAQLDTIKEIGEAIEAAASASDGLVNTIAGKQDHHANLDTVAAADEQRITDLVNDGATDPDGVLAGIRDNVQDATQFSAQDYPNRVPFYDHRGTYSQVRNIPANDMGLANLIAIAVGQFDIFSLPTAEQLAAKQNKTDRLTQFVEGLTYLDQGSAGKAALPLVLYQPLVDIVQVQSEFDENGDGVVDGSDTYPEEVPRLDENGDPVMGEVLYFQTVSPFMQSILNVFNEQSLRLQLEVRKNKTLNLFTINENTVKPAGAYGVKAGVKFARNFAAGQLNPAITWSEADGVWFTFAAGSRIVMEATCDFDPATGMNLQEFIRTETQFFDGSTWQDSGTQDWVPGLRIGNRACSTSRPITGGPTYRHRVIVMSQSNPAATVTAGSMSIIDVGA